MRLNLIHSRRWQDFAAFLLLTSWVLFVYRSNWFAIPHGDQSMTFAHQRLFYSSDWQTFIAALSHTRTSQVNPGDTFLFRPGTTAAAFFFDWFDSGNFYILGMLSLLWHSLVALIVYRWFCQSTSKCTALLVAALFATQFAGMKMVVWRHISPYLLSLFFFGWGLLKLFIWQPDLKKRPPLITVALLFFLSTLFHETCALTLPVAGIVLAVLANVKKPPWLTRFQVLAITLGPALVFWILDFSSTLYYKNSALMAVAPETTTQSAALGNLIQKWYFFTGLFSTAFWLGPWGIINKSTSTVALYWNYSGIPSGVIAALAAVTIIVLFFFGLRSFFDWRRQNRPEAFLALTLIFYLLIFSLGIVAGRLNTRDLSYIQHASYYYYFSDFGLFLTFGLALKRFGMRRISTPLVVLLFVLCGYKAYRIDRALQDTHSTDSAIAKRAHQLADYFKIENDFCYGGPLQNRIAYLAQPAYLYRQSCYLKPGRPTYLNQDLGGKIHLVTLIGQNTASELIDLSRFQPLELNYFGKNAYPQMVDFKHLLLSRQTFDNNQIKISFEPTAKFAVLIGLKDAENFSLLVYQSPFLYTYGVKKRSVASFFISDAAPLLRLPGLLKERVSLSFIKVGEELNVFFGDLSVAQIPEQGDATGKIGLLLAVDDLNAMDNKVEFQEKRVPETATILEK